ncbi:MAG: T9SS type A sorting domain-containing protein [Cellulophaga sp.]|uniref:T9SS type A sorting domain-containing protein n=1 Tax=unclassified Cellulophaga TaxID=2634405 RepID=UPI000C2C72FD|nr:MULTISPECIES: T9SS type A sorting domain-containing protein [unclassified Cellulophaga]MDO6491743.1 T9SS type A sorting domain-containing protein [Cellulophaga sp. 2_MG-2023]MDO6495602.1 T9SS type A sorting domain-containing protein [Cellulophaga sp. 3_MG-2023]PKB43098.1 putative secreted protein (Por secretion system target) [Cellulophaga sp. RHA19]
MKQLYLVLFFAFSTVVAFGQDTKKVSDIEGLKLYPNPVTNGKIYISTKKNAPKKILVFDVLGTKALDTKLIGKELNVSNLDAGVYVIRIFEKDKVATRKLIIK